MATVKRRAQLTYRVLDRDFTRGEIVEIDEKHAKMEIQIGGNVVPMFGPVEEAGDESAAVAEKAEKAISGEGEE